MKNNYLKFLTLVKTEHQFRIIQLPKRKTSGMDKLIPVSNKKHWEKKCHKKKVMDQK